MAKLTYAGFKLMLNSFACGRYESNEAPFEQLLAAFNKLPDITAELEKWATEEIEKCKKEHEECCNDNTISFRDTVEAEGRLTEAEIFLAKIKELQDDR